MDSKKMFKNTIYSLLATLTLVLMPCMGASAQQQTDIKKPTRERVKNQDKKDDKKNNNKNNDSKKDDKKKDDKNTSVKATVKPAAKDDNTKTANKQDNTAKPVTKQDDKKDVKPAVDEKKDEAKEENKPAPPKPVDPNFDGIDVSKYQLNIDWQEIKKNAKIQYVYIKATEGCDHTDHRYEDNIRNARKNGVKVGSYHYLTNRSSATAQFQNFARTARKEEQDLIPFIDVEECNKWDSQQLRDSLKVFADLLEDYYGCKPMIYTSESFFKKHLGRSFKDYPLFIAKYSSNSPSIGYNWVMWQYSDKGTIPGIKSNVDLSRFNKGYSLNDIIYRPGKGKSKPKSSVKESVNSVEKPTSVNMTEQKPKQTPKKTKRQQEEEKKKAEKEKKTKELKQKQAAEEAKKQAEQKRKEQAKAEQIKRNQAQQKAKEEAAKKEAENKAKRKAEAQKAREQKAKQTAERKAANKASNKAASTFTSKMNQAQRNDSIRSANSKGKRTNKSSADND